MFERLQRHSCLLVISIIVLGNLICMIANTYAEEPKALLDWSIETSKKTFYPGEPILLTLKIANKRSQVESIFFGADGIGAFSMEIYDCNKIVAKGVKIERAGPSIRGPLELPTGKIAQKSIVLNQWCSTLLPPGQYHVVCYVEYRLFSENTKIPGTEHGFKAGPLHTTDLGLDINIIKMDISEFEKILERLNGGVIATNAKTKENLVNHEIAREMLVFAESELAVPYQLNILKTEQSTWRKLDAINSLVRSNTLEAANGLVQIVSENEVSPNRIEDVKREIIDAVYRLRETGKSDIINATDEFVRKHKRPPLVGKPLD